MKRRTFLSLGLSLPLWSLGCATTHTSPISLANRKQNAILIPGYDVKAAIKEGILSSPLIPYAEQTMISRLDLENGAIKRNIIPIRGHQICQHPAGSYAVFACQSTREMALVDTETLGLMKTGTIENKSFLGKIKSVFVRS